MNFILVLATVLAFFIADFLVRILLRKLEEARRARERREALDLHLRLDVAEEAPSLKRVELKDPLARILAVDDEEVVLDSFRKILVTAGYNVDTVETGQEALKLVQENEYDFVFTDLRMPSFSGLDVVKAVHHLKPGVDIIVITGYASVQTAVDCMQHGAVDYVEKPFTDEELKSFAKKSLLRRQERLAGKGEGHGRGEG